MVWLFLTFYLLGIMISYINSDIKDMGVSILWPIQVILILVGLLLN